MENYYQLALKFTKDTGAGTNIAPIDSNKQPKKGAVFATDSGNLIQCRPLKTGKIKVFKRNINAVSGGNISNEAVTHRFGYLMCNLNGTVYYLHRVIFEAFWGVPLTREDIIDHLDGNKLNASLDNLSLTTQRENAQKYHNELRKFIEMNNLTKLTGQEQRRRFFENIYKTSI